MTAAQELFAELGFERTTIRAVAARAGIDPALVMQYYGNKEGLFAAAAQWHVDHKRLSEAALEAIPRTALDDLFTNFEDAAHRDSAIALLRNCLTHEKALHIMRDDVMCEPQAAIAKTIGGDDADLRAGLLGAAMIGVTIA
ncbi:MAG: transcriptional regulator, TetR family, partial [Frankiales bacterium]|nr:transcriptional regulator, TetR family [Frankiales bacterium]